MFETPSTRSAVAWERGTSRCSKSEDIDKDNRRVSREGKTSTRARPNDLVPACNPTRSDYGYSNRDP